jgi:hypothetical protein
MNKSGIVYGEAKHETNKLASFFRVIIGRQVNGQMKVLRKKAIKPCLSNSF